MPDVKRCSTCGLDRPLSEFNRRALSVDGLQFRCRACSRAWYEKNKERHLKNVGRRNVAYRRELAARLAAYFAAHPCVDCGEADVRCLQFDHRDRSAKKANVSKMLSNSLPWRRILEEIDKCDVRCANCHSKKTAAEINSWRHQLHELYLATGGHAPVAARVVSADTPAGDCPADGGGTSGCDGRDAGMAEQ